MGAQPLLPSNMAAGPLAQLDPGNPPEGLGRLLLLFVLALVIVAPFALRTVRRVQAGEWASKRSPKSGNGEGNDAEGADIVEHTDRGTLEELIAAIRTLEGDRHGRAEVLVQRHLTSQGRELPPAMADTLVRDALRRSGWQVADQHPEPFGTTLECVPRPVADTDR